MKRSSISVLLLSAAILFSLSTVAHAANSVQTVEENPAVISIDPDVEAMEKENAVHVQPGETVFNNGETIYNDGGTIYNNGGVVFNNGGITYNNRGIIYNNGGTVFNNGGTVYDNGGDTFNNNGEVLPALRAGYNRITFAGDYSTSVTLDGLEIDDNGVLWLPEDAVLTITPANGLAVRSADAGAADCLIRNDGTLTVSHVTQEEKITLTLCPQKPVISQPSGTYSEAQTVSITAELGDIYYTTDNSDPTAENGTLYTGPVKVSKGLVLRAIAVQDGLENSYPSVESYAFVEISGPAFSSEKEGYSAVSPQAILFENNGSTNAVISSVELTEDKDRAFSLSTTDGGIVPAGTVDDSTWTLTPVKGLSTGKYSARLTVTLDSGETETLVVTFTVTA